MVKSKRWDVLVALAVGCAAGWALCASSGCAALWMATARADDVVTVECSNGVATHDIGSSDPADLARVTVITTPAKPVLGGPLPITAIVSVPRFNGSVGWTACTTGDAVAFVTR